MPLASERPAIKVEHLSIRFKTTSEHRLRGRNSPIRVARNLWHRTKTSTVVTALDDVSFDVASGQVVGIVGPNGAGKSTLCRALAGILPPDEGRISVYGRAIPLLSLGMGFNRELTGRENILLGGLVYGLEPDEIRDRQQRIIDFADIGSAIDHPMRTYSNGMFGRIGFALASHLDPEIILIDEALAAGDASFKDRSRAKIEELCSGACTVLVVSHGLLLVKSLASTALWLDHGKVVSVGDSEEVVDAYIESEGVDETEAVLDDF